MNTPVKNQKALYEVTIGDHVYEFAKWPIRVWTDRYLMLMAVAGEFLARAVAAANFGRAPDENMVGALAEALMRNMGKDRKLSLELIEALASEQVFRDSRPVKFTVDFNDQPMDLHRVCLAALQVQFGPLFSEVQALLRTGQFKSSPEQTSSETSGASSTQGSGLGSTSMSVGQSTNT